MQHSIISFDNHPLFMIVCVIVASAYTYVLYRRSTNWSKKQRIFLSVLRFAVVFILSVLLIGPVIKQAQKYFEKPVFVIAVDNSLSISFVLDTIEINEIKQSIEQMHNQLESRNYDVEIRSLNGALESAQNLTFKSQTTNINGLLSSIANEYENRNLAKVVLFSDGIYNEGISPDFANYNYSLNAIGLGDTIPKKDLLIRELNYNKISYQGNKFPLIVDIENMGYAKEPIGIKLYKNGKLLDQKIVTPTANESIETIEFLVDADNKGLQRYLVSIDNKSEEFNHQNNHKSAYVDIIEGKERILMIAASPHPDIKAIRGAIETNENYEFILFIPGINKEPEDNYDLVIYHQFPDNRGRLLSWFAKFKDTPNWIITTPKSNFSVFNSQISTTQIQLLGRETDNISATFNDSFSSFSISDHLKSLLEEVPPLQVPFGNISSSVPVMLYQKLGSVTTTNPLLVLSDIDDAKSAVFFADGLYKWKLFEFAKYEHHKGFNELVLKTVQYLSTRQDKRKFKFYPITREINTSESVQFQTEVYNDLYEPVYDQSVKISITSENGLTTNYEYITSITNSQFRISGLAEGIYNYTASVLLNNEKNNVTGEFYVAPKNIELTNLTADFNLLKSLAKKGEGKFYTQNEVNTLINDLLEKNDPEIIHNEETFQPLINLNWVFILLILLVSVEWFYRKYSGHY